MVTLQHAVESARIALDGGDWDTARSLLEDALDPTVAGERTHDADRTLAAEAMHLLARAVEWSGKYEHALDLYESAFHAYREIGDSRVSAMIAAREISFLHEAVYGSFAVASGWLERARRLVASDQDCVEAGWVALAAALAASDPDEMDAHVRHATAIADRTRDPNLRFCALAYEGTVLVMRGKIADGMRCLDEAAAAAASGEVGDYITAGEIFCKMLLCCELTLDVRRAEQWTAIATSFASQANAGWVSAICRSHLGGVLTAAGRWTEAERELAESVALYDASYPALRSAALVRLADLRVGQGRFDEAARLLSGLEFDPRAPRPMARLHLSRGETDQARRVLQRAIGPVDHALHAPELVLLVETEIAAGDLPAARAVSARLSDVADAAGTPQVCAMADYAAGLVLEASGSPDALAHFEAALPGFAASGLPVDEARTRMAISRLLAGSSPEVAVAEARAALDIFDHLAATVDADAAAGHLRKLGASGRAAPRTSGPLTRRETEVLRLVAAGLSNDLIAQRLVISKRTVEHHVSHVLAKLGVGNRSEAVAYALRHLQQGAQQTAQERSGGRTAAAPD